MRDGKRHRAAFMRNRRSFLQVGIEVPLLTFASVIKRGFPTRAPRWPRTHSRLPHNGNPDGGC